MHDLSNVLHLYLNCRPFSKHSSTTQKTMIHFPTSQARCATQGHQTVLITAAGLMATPAFLLFIPEELRHSSMLRNTRYALTCCLMTGHGFVTS